LPVFAAMSRFDTHLLTIAAIDPEHASMGCRLPLLDQLDSRRIPWGDPFGTTSIFAGIVQPVNASGADKSIRPRGEIPTEAHRQIVGGDADRLVPVQRAVATVLRTG
jgi:hypothetical protein